MDNIDQPVSGVLDKFHEACVFGVQQSDNRTVEQAIDEWNNDTDTTDSSPVMSQDIEKIMSEVVNAVCPGQPPCNGSGVCNNSQCICDQGETISSFSQNM